MPLDTKKKIESGSVFCFGNHEIGFGCGQVLIENILYYIVIFEKLFKEKPDGILGVAPLLKGWTSDSRIISKDWIIIQKSKIFINEFLSQNYKVIISGQIWITDINGVPLRVAYDREINDLQYYGSKSPIAYEKAFFSYHGFGQWEDRFNELIL